MGQTFERWVRTGVAAAGALFLAGCSDSADVAGPGGGSGGAQLSSAEAAAISDFFVGQAFTGWDFSGVGGGSASVLQKGTPITIDYSVSVENACPEGGTVGVAVTIAGTIDDETGSGDLSLDAVTSASDCGIVADAVGFRLDTDPDLTLTGDFTFANGQLIGESTFTYAGSVAWVAEDGRSGSCDYDVAITVSGTETAVASGTVCGTSL